MTTNNHPAHGPVSLDRLHQIREILSKASAQSGGGNLGYAMADAVKVIDGAIAAFGVEPVPFDALRDAVAEVSGGPVMEWSDIYKGHQAVPFINFNSLARIVDKFRTSQPAPVVPTFDEWLEIRGNKPLGWVKDAMRESYDACRAAMLQDNQRDLSQPIDPQVAKYEQIMLQAGNSPVTQDGYVLVPKKLTAENGAKSVLSGEFSETKFINCPECFGDDECETCDGSGRIEITVPVSWTNIKAIWAKGVEHFEAAPQQENV